MIHTDEKYAVMKAGAAKLREAIAKAQTAPPPNVPPRLHNANIAFMVAQLKELEREMHEYEENR